MARDRKTIENEMAFYSAKCFQHAGRCRDCYHPIFDEEGNPQYVGEACTEGARLLTAYMKAEAAWFKEVPCED